MKKIMLVLAIFMCTGCSSFFKAIDGIAVSGEYQGIKGEIVFQLDEENTKKENRLVLEKITPDGEKKKIFTFTEEDINKIYEKMKKVVGGMSSSAAASTTIKIDDLTSNYQKILREIK